MKAIICLGILTLSSLALANSTTCSSPNQDLKYNEQTSNGGAFYDRGSITYQGLTHTMTQPITEGLDIKLNNPVTLSQNGATHIVGALATGSVTANGQTKTFSEWVICDEEIFADCMNCP